MPKRYRPQFVLPILGALLGYLLLHPYTMAVYTLAHLHRSGNLLGGWQWNDVLGLGLTSFKPSMIPMAVPFALLGALIGLLSGILMEKRKRLNTVEHENEKKKVALETLGQLMVTLSHYLLNANMIIGGKVRRLKRTVADNELLSAFEIIEEQAEKIDAVVGALNRITEIKTTSYTSQGQALLIDITKEIEESLQQKQKGESRGESALKRTESSAI